MKLTKDQIRTDNEVFAKQLGPEATTRIRRETSTEEAFHEVAKNLILEQVRDNNK